MIILAYKSVYTLPINLINQHHDIPLNRLIQILEFAGHHCPIPLRPRMTHRMHSQMIIQSNVAHAEHLDHR